MNFSDIFRASSHLCSYSPNGVYLATAMQHSLSVRDPNTMEVFKVYNCIDVIEYIEWSPDSELILCALYKEGVVQAFSIKDPDWKCKLVERLAGMDNVCWSPDCKHIITTADFKLWVAVWSLIDNSVSYMRNPHEGSKVLSFSPDGKYLALAERKDCLDYISILSTSTWQQIRNYQCGLQNLAGIAWSPKSDEICIWDSLLNYKLEVRSVEGKLLCSYSAYKDALGIKSVAWAPISRFLAIGSYDQKVRLLNCMTWRLIVELPHQSLISDEHCVIFQEINIKEEGFVSNLPVAESLGWDSKSKYIVLQERPVSIPIQESDKSKPNPKLGVGILKFSPNGYYLATRNDNMPKVLWIWDMRKLTLKSVLIHKKPITCVEWDPTQSRLALCTGTRNVFFWSPAGCVALAVPQDPNFQVSGIKCHPAGNAYMLSSPFEMVACFTNCEDAT